MTGLESTQAFRGWLAGQMRARRMSQQQLADRSLVHRSTISRLLSGDRSPSFETASQLAHALGVPLELDLLPAQLVELEKETSNPVLVVERALRADRALSEEQIRQVMRLYNGFRA